MTRRYALRDDQWERIKDLLPGRAFPLLSHCRRTIGCSWKLCCTDIGQEFPGVTCFLVHTRTAPMLKEWGVGAYVRSRIAQDADKEYARNWLHHRTKLLDAAKGD